MKRLWVLLLLFILVTPQAACCTIPESSTLEPLLVEGFSNRVYGINLARDIRNAISRDLLRQHISKLTENGSRYIMDYSSIGGANAAACNWLMDEMQALSKNRIELNLFGNYRNIIATLPGYLPEDDLPIFVVTAHYDTVSGSPGANGDGSGMASILELIRVMSEYEWPLDIVFIAFNGHDSVGSMQGAREVANLFMGESPDILALWNIDTILNHNRFVNAEQQISLAYLSGAPYHLSEYWADLAEMMGNLYGIDMMEKVASPDSEYWQSADSYQFVTRGFQNTLCFVENGISVDATYHSPSDVWDSTSFDYNHAREVTGYIASSMAFTMGRAYGHVIHLNAIKYIDVWSTFDMLLAITGPTMINLTCRWYSGGAGFTVYDPDGYVVSSVTRHDTSPWAPVRVLSVPVSQVGLYRVEVANFAYNAIGVHLEVAYDSDFDSNGVMDSEEYWLDTVLFHTDDDEDGVCNAEEIIIGTDSGNSDSDYDSISDFWEIANGFDPLNASDAADDPDGDQLTNAVEYSHGLNPWSEDSDLDGMIDPWELEVGLDPLVNDAEQDPDGDDISNLEEYLRGTDPFSSDLVVGYPLWIAVPAGFAFLLAIGFYVYRKLDPLSE